MSEGTTTTLDETTLERMYRELVRLRMLDERMTALQRQGRIGFYGACSGQEAAPVAVGLALRPDDWVFPALREAGTMLVRGFPLATFVAQVLGNEKDILKGRQMPSHMSGRQVHQASWSSCVGTQLPHAVGAAWAAKMKKDPVVVVGFLGDGATSTGDFHAAMNFAAVFCVPVVFVCQNNQYAISVPVSRQTAAPTLADKARAYAMPGVRADGNDVLEVHRVLTEAIEKTRAGAGPTFIELFTYRMGAHSTSDDPTRYRTEDEVERWAAADPIARFSHHLESRGLLSGEKAARIATEIAQEISRAIEEVEAAGPPDRSTLFQDVYAEMPWHLQEQWHSLMTGPPRAR
jgi:pyruvate dehydrogenase E1 component alpha subunit/2-oxoisovalerate dehydrogenase E1 component alpha subunit